MLVIDHVIIVVEDLDVAGRRFHEQHGLASVAGGRHAGYGTGNRIVPLGDQYLELMAVVDPVEAAASPLGSWVSRRLADVGEGPVAVCLRTDDIGGVARRTGQPPLAMGRTRPDGVELRWQLVALEVALSDGMPFFIEWDVAAADFPGRTHVEHRRSATGIAWVEVGVDEERLAAWLGPHDVPLRCVAGRNGPHRVAVAVAGDEPIIVD